MADISQKLGEIKDAVNGISDFLESGRRAVIHGTYEYLQQAYDALTQGELICHSQVPDQGFAGAVGLGGRP